MRYLFLNLFLLPLACGNSWGKFWNDTGASSPAKSSAATPPVVIPKSWYTMLGGAGTFDQANAIIQTSDGGYIVAGQANAAIASLSGRAPLNVFNASYDCLIVKLTTDGVVDWFTFLGGTGIDIANAIKQTDDGGYIIAGVAQANIPTLGGQTPLNAYSASSDYFVIRLTSAGSVVWYTFLGGGGSDTAKGVVQSPDGGYLVAGSSNATIATIGGQSPLITYGGTTDFMVVKLNSAGAVMWFTFLGGAGNDSLYGIDIASDGGFILGGQAGGNIPTLGGQSPLIAYTGSDALVIKLTAAGAVTWYTFLGGPASGVGLSSIRSVTTGGYIFTGTTSGNIPTIGGQTPLNAYAALNEYIVIRIDTNGTVLWYTYLGGSGNDTAFAITEVLDGGFVCTGQAGANIPALGGKSPINAYVAADDFFLIKLTNQGAISWYTMLGSAGIDIPYAISATTDGGVAVAGKLAANISTLGGQTPLNAYNANDDFLVVKLKSHGGF